MLSTKQWRKKVNLISQGFLGILIIPVIWVTLQVIIEYID